MNNESPYADREHAAYGTDGAKPLETLPEQQLDVSERIAKERYTSREFARLELDHMWPHVWQLACRERDIPKVGDFYEYQIGEESILIVRQSADKICAFYNTCQHRGNKLLSGKGKCGGTIVCAYHWWSYNLDGTLKNIPDRTDLEAPICDSEYGLAPVCADVWGGFVWVNMDLDAEPLADYLAPIPEQVSMYNLEGWYCTVNQSEVMSTNWKNPVDNFLEIYHIPALHPQIKQGFGWAADYGGQEKRNIDDIINDGRSPIDLYERHTRQVNPQGVSGGHAGRSNSVDQKRLAELLAERFGFIEEGQGSVDLEEGQSARQWLIRMMRDHYTSLGFDMSKFSDGQVVDRIRYHIFPNICLTVTPSSMLVWRARPLGDDPGECIMQIMEFSPIPKGMEDSIAEAPEQFFPSGKDRNMDRTGVARTKSRDGLQVYHQRMGQAAGDDTETAVSQHSFVDTIVEDQDYGILGTQQSGQRSRGFKGLRLMKQERRIRKYHEVIDTYLPDSPGTSDHDSKTGQKQLKMGEYSQ